MRFRAEPGNEANTNGSGNSCRLAFDYSGYSGSGSYSAAPISGTGTQWGNYNDHWWMNANGSYHRLGYNDPLAGDYEIWGTRTKSQQSDSSGSYLVDWVVTGGQWQRTFGTQSSGGTVDTYSSYAGLGWYQLLGMGVAGVATEGGWDSEFSSYHKDSTLNADGTWPTSGDATVRQQGHHDLSFVLTDAAYSRAVDGGTVSGQYSTYLRATNDYDYRGDYVWLDLLGTWGLSSGSGSSSWEAGFGERYSGSGSYHSTGATGLAQPSTQWSFDGEIREHGNRDDTAGEFQRYTVTNGQWVVNQQGQSQTFDRHTSFDNWGTGDYSRGTVSGTFARSLEESSGVHWTKQTPVTPAGPASGTKQVTGSYATTWSYTGDSSAYPYDVFTGTFHEEGNGGESWSDEAGYSVATDGGWTLSSGTYLWQQTDGRSASFTGTHAYQNSGVLSGGVVYTMNGTENLSLTAGRFQHAATEWHVAGGRWRQTGGSSLQSAGSVAIYDYAGSGTYSYGVISGTHAQKGGSLDVQSLKVTGTFRDQRWTSEGSGGSLHCQWSAYDYSGSGSQTVGLITGTLSESGQHREWDVKTQAYRLLGDRWQVRGNGLGGESGSWRQAFTGSGPFVGEQPGVVGTATLQYGDQFGYGRTQTWTLGRGSVWVRTSGGGSGAGAGYYDYAGSGSGTYTRAFNIHGVLNGVNTEGRSEDSSYRFGEGYTVADGLWQVSGSGHAEGQDAQYRTYAGSGTYSAAPDSLTQYTSQLAEQGARSRSGNFTLDWDYASGRPVNWTSQQTSTGQESHEYTFTDDYVYDNSADPGHYDANGIWTYSRVYVHCNRQLHETTSGLWQRTEQAGFRDGQFQVSRAESGQVSGEGTATTHTDMRGEWPAMGYSYGQSVSSDQTFDKLDHYQYLRPWSGAAGEYPSTVPTSVNGTQGSTRVTGGYTMTIQDGYQTIVDQPGFYDYQYVSNPTYVMTLGAGFSDIRGGLPFHPLTPSGGPLGAVGQWPVLTDAEAAGLGTWGLGGQLSGGVSPDALSGGPWFLAGTAVGVNTYGILDYSLPPGSTPGGQATFEQIAAATKNSPGAKPVTPASATGVSGVAATAVNGLVATALQGAGSVLTVSGQVGALAAAATGGGNTGAGGGGNAGAAPSLAAFLPASLNTMLQPNIAQQVSGATAPSGNTGGPDLSAAAGVGQAPTVEWNAQGQITSVVGADPDGAGPEAAPVVTFTYNAAGNLVHMTLPGGATQQWTYDESGEHVLSYTDELGHTTFVELDPVTGQVQAVHQVVGQIDSAENGETDDVVTTYYDALGRLTTVVLADPDGEGPENGTGSNQDDWCLSQFSGACLAISYTYDKVGNVLSETDSLGRTTTYTYDARDRLVSATLPDPDGAGPLPAPVVSYTYDAAGQLLSETDPTGNVTTYEYDALGRTTKVIQDADGSGPEPAAVTTNVYDIAGRLVAVTDPLGHTTSYTYDDFDRATAITDANGGVTAMAYDAAGNLLSLTDPDGNTTTWTYDGLNRVTSETNELGATRSFQYDAAGEQTRRTDRDGRVTLYAYDALGRMTSESWYDDASDADAAQNATNVIHYEYDAAGRLVSEWDEFSSYSYTYDALDRVTTETVANPGAPVVVFTTGYAEPDNLRTSFSATIGGVADFQRTYEYDALGQMVHIGQASQAGGNSVAAIGIDLQYDASGRLTGLDRYLGTALVATSTWQYDARGNLTSLLQAQGTTTLAEYAWTYDAAGRLTDAMSSDGTVHYTYDATDQLTGADYTVGGGLPTVPPDETYTYDANGNRTTVATGGSPVTYITGPNNEVLFDGTYRYTYDPEGNRTARFIWTDADADGQVDSGERSQITDYAWDNRNRLVTVTDSATDGGPATQVVHYTYDTHNRWISRTLDPDGDGTQSADATYFVHDGNQIVLTFVDPDGPSGSSSPTLANRLLWGPAVDQLLADEQLSPLPPGEGQGEGRLLWPLTDHLGTIRDLAEFDTATGITAIVNHRVFDAYGQLLAQTNAAVDCFFAFTGRPFDEATGLQNNVNRWYDVVLARWLSQDPYGFNAGESNLYGYVGNNAVSTIDPTGMEEWWESSGWWWLNPWAYNFPVGQRGFVNWVTGNYAADRRGADIAYTARTNARIHGGAGDPNFDPERWRGTYKWDESEARIAKRYAENGVTANAALLGGAGLRPRSYVYDAASARYRDAATGRFVAARDLPWPANAGFRSSTRQTVPVGKILDRYGSPDGRFLSQPGASISQRGMPAGSEALPYTRYRVVRAFDAQVGPVAPVPEFGATGGATQYLPGNTVQWLIDNGFLEAIK